MPEEPEVELVFHESLTSLVTPAFCRTVLQALATPPAHLRLDLEDVKVADVTGPAALLQAVRLCDTRGVKFALRHEWTGWDDAQRLTFETPTGATSIAADATVLTLFLLPRLNVRLIPKLTRELRPGTRVVSHQFDMGDEWPAERSQDVDGLTIYLWTIR